MNEKATFKTLYIRSHYEFYKGSIKEDETICYLGIYIYFVKLFFSKVKENDIHILAQIECLPWRKRLGNEIGRNAHETTALSVS